MASEARPPRRVPVARRAGAWIVWWVLLMSFWVIPDDSIALDELLPPVPGHAQEGMAGTFIVAPR
ncbi:MAG TPA: hypothetical protein VMV92_07875 [Streptosporangiaceae bacterium]|nr:hypothetical protein [Streptosporangiaceae bacterium]